MRVRVNRLGVSLLIGAVLGLIASGLVFASMKSWFGRELSSPLIWFAPGMLVRFLELKSANAYEWSFKLVNVLYYTAIAFAFGCLLEWIKSGRKRNAG